MPGAADAAIGHDAVGERPVIMAAMRIDRENLRAGSRQQDVLLADMAEQHVVLEVIGRNAEREIGSGGRALVFGHVGVLLRYWMIIVPGSSRRTSSPRGRNRFLESNPHRTRLFRP